jgi:hypothetical protein
MGFKKMLFAFLLPAAGALGAAADAGATLRVENHLDPAGDTTVIGYRLEGPTLSPSLEFSLMDRDYRSFGPPAGTYTVQALLPAGWQTSDIECVGPRPEAIATDPVNARVTLEHGADDEHTCAFTNRRIPPGGAPPSWPGIAPSPPASELPKVVLPDRAEVLRIVPGRRSAAATLRLVRPTVIKARLQTARGRVLGTKRIERDAGTRVVRVRVGRREARRLLRRGRDEVTLTLRIVTIERGGATRVFRHRVVVEL